MRMTVLRALKKLEMDVDLEHKTSIGNIEKDSEGNITIYGNELLGELYYVVIDKEVAGTISSLHRMPLPSITLTPNEMFALGNAYGSFSVGEIDQGIHALIAVKDQLTGERKNEIFQDLLEEYFFEVYYPPGYKGTKPFQWPEDEVGDKYMQAIRHWAAHHNLNLFTPPENGNNGVTS